MSTDGIFPIALKLLRLGFSVIPSGGGPEQKRPNLIPWTPYQERLPTEEELLQWEDQYHPRLWGIVTGSLSGIVDIEVDDNPEARADIEARLGPAHINSPRGGGHWYVHHPSGCKVKTIAPIPGLVGVDCRGDGGMANIVGASIYGPYVINILPAPDNLYDWAKLPERYKVVEKDKAHRPTQTIPGKQGERIPQGHNDQWLISQAGVYRRRGDSEKMIFEKLQIDAGRLDQNPNRRPYDDDDFRRIAHSAGRYEPDAPPRQTGYIVTDKNGNQTLDQDAIVTDLLAEFHFKTYEDTNQVLVYRNGVYQAGGEQFVKAECQRRVGVRALLSEHRVNEIVGHIRRSTFSKRAEFNRPGETINLQNGLLNVRTRLLSSHTPEFLSTVQLPIAYHPDAKGTRVGRFFSETLNSSAVPLIAEFFGFCLLYEYRIQKAFLLVGEGSNGKSTLLKLLMAFVGECNCSHVSWQQLELNRFAMADLEGKLVNSFADLPSQGMSMTTAFKMLTGGDSISAERKFMPSFSFVNFAKLIFSTNKPPKVDGEDSFAFWRRWIIVEFPNSFTGSADDPNLIDALATPAELSGLLNLALDGLDRLHRDHAFTYARTVEETSEYYLRAADPVYAFIQDCCEIGSGLWVSKENAYNVFKANCEAKQIPLLRPNSFARALQNQPSVRITPFRPEVNDERIQAWQGITLCKEKTDVANKTLTRPRLASGMSGQNDTSNAYAHGNSSLKLQKNADNPDATLKSDFQNSDATIKNLTQAPSSACPSRVPLTVGVSTTPL